MATPPSAAVPRITAMVVDDSAVVRKHLADLLQAGGIEVIATASDPLFAWPKMAARWPDVVVLDVEMPRMDGISFLRKIMAERPTPMMRARSDCSTPGFWSISTSEEKRGGVSANSLITGSSSS